MDANFNLPLDLNNSSGLKTFLFAISDKEIYKILLNEIEKLPKVAQEILTMINDEHFKETSKEIAVKYSLHRRGYIPLEILKKEGKDFGNYLMDKYPVGYGRIQEFAKGMHSLSTTEVNSFETNVASDVAVAVEAVTAAAVWANVAAVTNVVVALEAVVTVGVVVV